jgi:hypothetical protein
VIGALFRRLEPFLYSRRNIVGSVLALGGLGLYFAGLLGGLIWLPIVGGLYLIGYLLVPGEPGLDLKLDQAGDVSAVQSGLDRLLNGIRGKVADDIYGRVSSIRDEIVLILKAADTTIGTADPNIYLIRQTALDYLPAALQAYLAVPRLYAERRAVAGGKTPHDVLLDQLALMDAKMQEVLQDVLKHDSDKLLAQGRFIAEKFAPSSLSLGTTDDAGEATIDDATDAATADQAEPVEISRDGTAGTTSVTASPKAAAQARAGVHEAQARAADRRQ